MVLIKQPRSGLDNGLAPNRRQTIIWTNADPIYRRIYAALGGEELTKQWCWTQNIMCELGQCHCCWYSETLSRHFVNNHGIDCTEEICPCLPLEKHTDRLYHLCIEKYINDEIDVLCCQPQKSKALKFKMGYLSKWVLFQSLSIYESCHGGGAVCLPGCVIKL